MLGGRRNRSRVPREDPGLRHDPCPRHPEQHRLGQEKTEKSPSAAGKQRTSSGCRGRAPTQGRNYRAPAPRGAGARGENQKKKRGRMPESSSSARFQGFPSSPPFQTLLPSPVSGGGGCSPPGEHEHGQRGRVQGKASAGQDFLAGRCFRQTDACTVGASAKGAGREPQPPAA